LASYLGWGGRFPPSPLRRRRSLEALSPSPRRAVRCRPVQVPECSHVKKQTCTDHFHQREHRLAGRRDSGKRSVLTRLEICQESRRARTRPQNRECQVELFLFSRTTEGYRTRRRKPRNSTQSRPACIDEEAEPRLQLLGDLQSNLKTVPRRALSNYLRALPPYPASHVPGPRQGFSAEGRRGCD